MPFTSYSSTSDARSIAHLQFTGHRVNLGLSYSKFAYDGAGAAQLNAQLSQWESTCRWCCHARPDTVCNIEMKTINSSPFATKCGNSVGTNRSQDITIKDSATNDEYSFPAHDMYTYLNEFKTHIDTTAAYASNQREYWAHLDTFTGNINGISYTLSTTAGTPPTHDDNRCSLSNAVWDVRLDNTDTADDVEAANTARVPQNIHGKFRFFQPFNIAQSNADYYNDDTDVYEVGPRFWMQMFQRTPQYDLSHGILLLLNSMLNSHQLVKEEILLEWTNSLEEQTNLDGLMKVVLLKNNYVIPNYVITSNNKPIWSPKKTETSLMREHGMLVHHKPEIMSTLNDGIMDSGLTLNEIIILRSFIFLFALDIPSQVYHF